MVDLSLATPPQIIGQSRPLLDALEHVSASAALDRPLLIIGERGTGKELFAARAHFLSRRWDRDYVKVNCAALSDDLLESELFGHEAGAFTGAAKRHIGRFERADRGTLFLDEIASASLRVQEKTLRVLEYGEFERIGGEETLSADVRLVAATNVDLPSRAAAGSFRADLLDRIAFDVVTLPPLRARWEDIPVLAEHFGRRMAADLGAERFAGFTPRAMGVLFDHDWPGNIRELKNVVERAVHHAIVLRDSDEPIDDITIDPFASPYRPATSAPDTAQSAPSEDSERARSYGEQIAALEERLVREALVAEDWHQGRAAERLGLSYHQLRGVMRKHGVVKSTPSGADAERATPDAAA